MQLFSAKIIILTKLFLSAFADGMPTLLLICTKLTKIIREICLLITIAFHSQECYTDLSKYKMIGQECYCLQA